MHLRTSCPRLNPAPLPYYEPIAGTDDSPRRAGAAPAAGRPGLRLREVARLDRSRLAVAAAVPSAVGYAVPLVAGLAAGHVADGIAASAGALIVGFANLGGRYRVRSATLLAATLAAGVAALLGGLAGPSGVATVVLMGVWGFAGGLLVSLGTRIAFVGMLSTWALLLAGDLNLHGAAVLHEAWLITAGGLTQTVIAVAVWPLRPFGAERRAVADAYRALAAYARAPDTAALQSTAAALAAAAETVGAGPSLPGERGTLRALVEQGEWVRLELAALSRSEVPGVNGTLGAAARALDAIAAGSDPAPSLTDLTRTARGIGEPAARRRAVSLVEWIAAAGRQSHAGAPGAAQRRHPLHVLRAELTLRSSAFRHAARLSVALVVAGIVYRGLSLGSGYWVPLTVLFVLKPDYGTTMARGIGRAAGTMAGVTIAWAIVTLFSPSSGAIVALLALLACVAYAVFPANYALLSVVLTVLIALLAEFSGGSPAGALARPYRRHRSRYRDCARRHHAVAHARGAADTGVPGRVRHSRGPVARRDLNACSGGDNRPVPTSDATGRPPRAHAGLGRGPARLGRAASPASRRPSLACRADRNGRDQRVCADARRGRARRRTRAGHGACSVPHRTG